MITAEKLAPAAKNARRELLRDDDVSIELNML
jgi:hypothetical protein